MNRPDDKTLKSWLEGELEGDELSSVEAWAQAHVGELDEEFKCEIGWDALNDKLISSIPGSQEPPYPEFFNNKIQQAIFDDIRQNTVNETTSTSLWQKLRLMIVPAAIAALVAFYAGTKLQHSQPKITPEFVSEVSSIYVPNDGIAAAVSESADATEIVLSGLTPISDELDIAAGETSPGRSPMMASSKEELHPYMIY